MQKIATSLLVGMTTVVFCSLPSSVEALPFRENCASLQDYFRSRFQRTANGDSVKYQGFEGSQYFDNYRRSMLGFADREAINAGEATLAICSGGYLTLTSPQGTKVCKGTIKWFRDRPMNISYENCRWRN